MKNIIGKFIVFEGLDFSGKSTQIKLLLSYLDKQKVKYLATREPGGTTLSEKLRPIILNTEIDPITELFLYEAARREHFIQKIKPALEQGINVISDRFYDSSIAYQAYGRKLDLDIVNYLNQVATKQNLFQKRSKLFLKPDLTIFIDIPISIIKERLKNRKTLDKFEKNLDEDFFKRVRTGFLEIAKSRPDYKIINGTQNIQEIHLQILDIIQEFNKG